MQQWPPAGGVSVKNDEEEILPLWRAKIPEINKDGQALRREETKLG